MDTDMDLLGFGLVLTLIWVEKHSFYVWAPTTTLACANCKGGRDKCVIGTDVCTDGCLPGYQNETCNQSEYHGFFINEI